MTKLSILNKALPPGPWRTKIDRKKLAVENLCVASKAALAPGEDRVLTWVDVGCHWPTGQLLGAEALAVARWVGISIEQLSAYAHGYELKFKVKESRRGAKGDELDEDGLPPAREDFLAIDLETTGRSRLDDRVTEVGICAVKGGRIVFVESLLINPCKLIPYKIQRLTGITDDDVAGAAHFSDVAVRLHKWIERAPLLVAHNSSFDIGFLKAEFKRVGLWLSDDKPVVCTLKEARKATKRALLKTHDRKHDLASVASALGIKQHAHHRAGDDARVCAEILLELDRCRRVAGYQESF